MTQESALSREEIEAMDQDLGTTEPQASMDADPEQVAVRSQEPEAKS